jgi:phospholipid-binding lipoprotein MlaA
MTKTQKHAHNARSALAVVAAAALMTGCATSGNPKDPIEGFNRAMFSFNETVDKALIKPVAQGYDYVTPQPVQTGVSNFFDNIADLWIGFNNLIQGKPGEALSDVGRVLINTTVGIVGLFDVATGMGLEKHEEDFGQTLGRWGVGDGAYVVLPIFGPRTLRDTGGFLVDVWVDPSRIMIRSMSGISHWRCAQSMIALPSSMLKARSKPLPSINIPIFAMHTCSAAAA